MSRPVSWDLEPTEEERLLDDQVRRFAKTLRAHARRTEAEGLSAELRDTWGGLGLDRAADLGLRVYANVLAQLGFGDAAATLALDGSVAGTAVDLDGRLRVVDGRLTGTLPLVCGRTASLDVLCRTDEGARRYRLDDGFDAVEVDVGALDAVGGSRVVLDAAAVPTAMDVASASAWLARRRLPLAAVLVGLSRAAYEYARDYCLERVTFGRKVAHHQAVAFLLADMATSVEAAAVTLDFGACAETTDALDQAWVQACETALFCTDLGVQLLGAAGYVSDHPVEKWMREARAATLLLGGRDGRVG